MAAGTGWSLSALRPGLGVPVPVRPRAPESGQVAVVVVVVARARTPVVRVRPQLGAAEQGALRSSEASAMWLELAVLGAVVLAARELGLEPSRR